MPIRHWYDLRQAMRLRVTVRDPADRQTYRFVADSLQSYQRGRAFLTKEPDTIAWLRRALRPSDVFLDIGANVGTFSIFAARRISKGGHVYACEPHLPTTVQLLQNIAANRLEDRVSVVSIAASGADGFVPFHYRRWRQGASGSQLTVDGAVPDADYVGTELKCGMRLDTMIAQGIIRRPNLIKIDTDGIEFQILSGMTELLRSEDRPRSVLTEVQPGELQRTQEFMAGCGYALADAHALGRWKRMLDRGHSLHEVAFNALFEPAAVPT